MRLANENKCFHVDGCPSEELHEVFESGLRSMKGRKVWDGFYHRKNRSWSYEPEMNWYVHSKKLEMRPGVKQ